MKFCFCANLTALLMAGSVDMANGQVLSTKEIIDILKDESTIPTRSITVDDIRNRKDTPDFVENAVTRGLKVEERKQLDNYVSTYARPSVAIYIGFDLNSSTLSDSARITLRQLSAALISPDLKDSTFSLSGHTDASGASDNNQLLSERRAFSVRDFLVSSGVPLRRLIAAGYGEERPKRGLDGNDPKNRRVEIINLGTP